MNLGVPRRVTKPPFPQVLRRLTVAGFSRDEMDAVRGAETRGGGQFAPVASARRRGYEREAIVALARSGNRKLLRRIGSAWARGGDGLGFAALELAETSPSPQTIENVLLVELQNGGSIIAAVECATAHHIRLPDDVLAAAAERQLECGQISDALVGFALLGRSPARETLINVASSMITYRRYNAARLALQAATAMAELRQLAQHCLALHAYRDALLCYAAGGDAAGIAAVKAAAVANGDDRMAAEADALLPSSHDIPSA
jgi:hypothetical protein